MPDEPLFLYVTSFRRLQFLTKRSKVGYIRVVYDASYTTEYMMGTRGENE
jgi:hypothetical protein